MKKVFVWYNFLLEKKVLEFSEEQETTEENEVKADDKGPEDKSKKEEAEKA
jgi:hypothetical protein